jgi:hypothetical protein
MDLAAYFEKTDGTGILATCDPGNMVDMAIYDKPLVVDEKTIVFVMRQRLSHQNLRANLSAAYMFIEKGPGYKGLRLHLTMQREETNRTLVAEMQKKQPCICSEKDDSEKFLVFFTIDRVRPLAGDGVIG